jgi:hypothetical protein
MKQQCLLCNGIAEVTGCGDGHICQPCADRNRVGRDGATQKAKLLQKALAGRTEAARTKAKGGEVSDLDTYAIESTALLALDEPVARPPMLPGGEVAPQGDAGLLDTLAAPGVVAMDASAERIRLVSQIGTDCTAMALDASDTIQAANSLEKMLSHQLASCHQMAMDHIAKASLQQNPENSVRLLNLSLRAMDAYQRGLMTLKRLRSNGQQQIRIEHIDARGGGMVAVSGGQPQGSGGQQ